MIYQAQVAQQSLISGVLSITAGMLYGTQIHSGTVGHPVLTLATHVQFLFNGILQVIGGLILHTPQACTITGTVPLRLIQFGNGIVPWFVYAVEVWGSANGVFFSKHIKEAGLPPPDAGLLEFFNLMHFGPGFILLTAWVTIGWYLRFQPKSIGDTKKIY